MCTGGGLETLGGGGHETNYLTFFLGGYETNYDICGGGGGGYETENELNTMSMNNKL